MRLLLTIGYQHLLFPDKIDTQKVLEALEKAIAVEASHEGGKKIWKPCEDQDVEIKLVQGDLLDPLANLVTRAHVSAQAKQIEKLEAELAKAHASLEGRTVLDQ